MWDQCQACGILIKISFHNSSVQERTIAIHLKKIKYEFEHI
jgi:hypothetical protein